MHSSYRLCERARPNYNVDPPAHWDIDPKGATYLEVENKKRMMIVVSLDNLWLDDDGNSSNSLTNDEDWKP